MRRFFLIFLSFFLVFLLFSVANAGQNDKNTTFFSIDETVNYFDSFKQSLSSKVSESKRIETAFGDIQIFSDATGTLNTNTLLFVLDIRIANPGKLLNPHLELKSATNVADASFFYPVSLPISPQDGIAYYKATAIPFWINVKEKNQAVSFDLTFQATWCQENDCVLQDYTIPFALNPEYNYHSQYAAFIINAFRLLPKKAPDDKIRAHLYKDDSLWVFLGEEKWMSANPTFLLLDKDNMPIKYTYVSHDSPLFILQTDKAKLVKDIIIQIDENVYRQELNLTKQDLPEIKNISLQTKKIPFYVWMLFYFFSPVIVLLFTLEFRNEIVVRPILKRQIIGISFGVLSGIVIYSVFPYTYLINSKLWAFFGFCLFLALSVKRYQLTSYAYGLLAAIVPYFVLLTGNDIYVPTTELELLSFFVKLTLLNIWLFILLYFKPIIAVRLSQGLKRSYTKINAWPFIIDTVLFAIVLCSLLFKS